MNGGVFYALRGLGARNFYVVILASVVTLKLYYYSGLNQTNIMHDRSVIIDGSHQLRNLKHRPRSSVF